MKAENIALVVIGVAWYLLADGPYQDGNYVAAACMVQVGTVALLYAVRSYQHRISLASMQTGISIGGAVKYAMDNQHALMALMICLALCSFILTHGWATAKREGLC